MVVSPRHPSKATGMTRRAANELPATNAPPPRHTVANMAGTPLQQPAIPAKIPPNKLAIIPEILLHTIPFIIPMHRCYQTFVLDSS